MGSIIRMIASCPIRQEIVKPLRIAAKENTEERGNTHRQKHIDWGLQVSDPNRVQKSEEWYFDPGMVKNPADAIAGTTTRECPLRAVSVMMIDLLTKPLNKGKADMEAAPIIQKPVVQGIVL